MSGRQARLVGIGILMLLAAEARAESENFDSSEAGALPPQWTCGVSGRGTPMWAVERDDTAPSKPNVLKKSGQGTFPWCVNIGSSLIDGYVETRFKPIAGKEDQAAGLVWRFTGPKSFYVARANALENNVSLYYMWRGWRRTIQYVDAPVPLGEWGTLRVDFSGDRIEVSLNGKIYIDVRDDRIPEAGHVGVWTKADSVTIFDDFSFARTH
ncbi:MAG TPA: family 16 glycoside hydrolase [Burkholderiales bacterium]|nr:family 16 glycoside hydrolase [Burkholderiales bacterium]